MIFGFSFTAINHFFPTSFKATYYFIQLIEFCNILYFRTQHHTRSHSPRFVRTFTDICGTRPVKKFRSLSWRNQTLDVHWCFCTFGLYRLRMEYVLLQERNVQNLNWVENVWLSNFPRTIHGKIFFASIVNVYNCLKFISWRDSNFVIISFVNVSEIGDDVTKGGSRNANFFGWWIIYTFEERDA